MTSKTHMRMNLSHLNVLKNFKQIQKTFFQFRDYYLQYKTENQLSIN